MATFGNANASSLVRTARSQAERNANLQDQYEQYKFDLSEKSEADYNAWNSYLESRKATTTNPTKLLSYSKDQNSAYSGYRSNAIQKMNIQINYGGASLYDKRNMLDQQYREALQIGNMDLAQSIELQRSNVDIQIQNKEVSAANANAAAGKAATDSQVKAYKKVVTQIDNNESRIDAAFSTGDSIQVPTSIDDAGNITGTKTVKVTANNMEALKANLTRLKDQVYGAALERGLDDEDGSLAEAREKLRSSKEYVNAVLTNRAASSAEGIKGKGRERTADGYKTFDLDVVASQYARDGKGNLIPMRDAEGNPIKGEYQTTNIYRNQGFYGGDGKTNYRNAGLFQMDGGEQMTGRSFAFTRPNGDTVKFPTRRTNEGEYIMVPQDDGTVRKVWVSQDGKQYSTDRSKIADKGGNIFQTLNDDFSESAKAVGDGYNATVGAIKAGAKGIQDFGYNADQANTALLKFGLTEGSNILNNFLEGNSKKKAAEVERMRVAAEAARATAAAQLAQSQTVAQYQAQHFSPTPQTPQAKVGAATTQLKAGTPVTNVIKNYGTLPVIESQIKQSIAKTPVQTQQKTSFLGGIINKLKSWF